MKLFATITVAVLTQCTVLSHAERGLADLSGRYRCGAEGVRLGLPAKAFTVHYVGTGAQSRAVLLIHGRRVVLKPALAADGTRYVSGRYTWWDAARPSFTVDDERPDQKTAFCTHAD